MTYAERQEAEGENFVSTVSVVRAALAFGAILSPALSMPAAAAEPEIDAEILVSGMALPPSPGLDAYAVSRIGEDDLARAASPRLDDVLRNMPGATLFRRASSRVSHPTSQGLSLRGIGPNGAGRTLVLVDGVPANDPFGGWVYWSALPTANLSNVEVIRGGGAGPWGNAAIAGTVRIATRIPEGQGVNADLSWGNKDSLDALGQVWTSFDNVTVDLTLHHADSDGYHVLRPEDRGAVDRPASNESSRAAFGVTWRGADGLNARLTFGIHDEERGNGTDLAVNDTRSYDASLRLVQRDADGEGFEATIYALDRSFASSFTSVTADRSSESLSLLQYDVPARTIGGNLVLRRNLAGGVVEFGGDLRYVEGETREYFNAQNGVFQRDRRAGGEQWLGGLFVEYSRDVSDATRITGGVRIDHLVDRAGSRRETEIASGALVAEQTYPTRDKTVLNGRLGVTHALDDALDLRAVAYSGFRQPTINELYRPFRVRNDITEANAGLKPERLYGGEFGLEWRPADNLALDLGAFYTRLRNAVANVFVTDAPGFHDDLGVFVPAGGSLSQRRNLERMRTAGIEAAATWRATPALSLSARYLYVAAEVTRALDEPATEGKRPPMVPRHQGSINVAWSPMETLRTEAVLRGESAQYDDSLNKRPLAGYVTLDLFAGFDLAEGVELYAAAENVFDKEIEVGRASNGLLTIGTPRLVRGGVRLRF